MGKTDANKVLGTFRNNYEDRKKSMMKSYNEGGFTDQLCTGWNGKRRCKKKYGKRGGKLKKVLKAVGTAAGTAAATIGGIKLFKNFKDNGGF